MRQFLWSHLAILILFGASLGCGSDERAVIPSGPVAAPKAPPKAMPMIGPKIPQNQGK